MITVRYIDFLLKYSFRIAVSNTAFFISTLIQFRILGLDKLRFDYEGKEYHHLSAEDKKVVKVAEVTVVSKYIDTESSVQQETTYGRINQC